MSKFTVLLFTLLLIWTSFAALPVISDLNISSNISLDFVSATLTASWTATDADLDAVYNITDWRLENGSIAVLNMPFEGGSNDTFTRDYSNNSNNGIVTNAIWNQTGGYDGFGAYEFDGEGDWINASVPPIGLGNYTICSWVKTSASDAIIVSNGNSEDGDYQFIVSGSFVGLFAFYDGGLYVIGGVTPINDSQWHFACVQFNPSGSAGIYLDGSFDGGAGFAPATPAAGSTNVFIGDDQTGFPSFNGTIDHVTIWSRLLSEAQLDALYENRTDVLVSEETYLGDSWNVCVTPNDGTQDGTTECSNDLYLSSAPIISNLTLISALSTNTTSENLTAYWNTSSPLNLPVYNITNWFVNGTSITVLNMPFDGGSNSTFTKDYSPYANNGTVNGAIWNQTGGHNGFGAYEFDGTDDYIDLGSTETLKVEGGPFSVSVWVYPRALNASGYQIITSSANVDNQGYFLTLNSPYCFSGINLDLAKSGIIDQCIEYQFNNESWYHIVAVQNFVSGSPSSVDYYVNGMLVDTYVDSNPYTISSLPQVIGYPAPAISSYFNGSIDNFQIYNRSLSAEQVLGLYNNQTNLIVSQETEVGDIWGVCVTPNDGTQDGTEVCSNNLTILAPNMPPTLSNLTLNSTLGTNLTSENLTAYWNVSDSDEDPIVNITNWYLNNNSITSLNLPFEGGSNSTFTRDYSPYGNNGTVDGATWNQNGGHDGFGAYRFDGIDDWIDVTGQESDYDIGSGNFSVEFWINLSSTQAGTFLVIDKSHGFADSTGWLMQGVGTITWGYGDGSDFGNIVTTTTDLRDDLWHHVVGTYNGTHIAIYLDGIEEDSLAVSAPAADNDRAVEIGSSWGGGGRQRYLEGSLDDIRIYNRSLKPAQILALYQNRNDLIVSQETEVGDIWSVCVTPNDGNQDGTELCSNNLTVVPTPDDSQSTNLSEWRMFGRYLNHTAWDGISFVDLGINQSNVSVGGVFTGSAAVANGYVYVGNWNGYLYQFNASNISELVATFYSPSGGYFTASPVLTTDYVYISNEDNTTYQLNASNISQQIANFTTGDSVSSSFVLGGGYAYVGSTDGVFYQLNASNISEQIANFTVDGGPIISSAALTDNFVYIGTYDDTVYQLDATNVSQQIASFTTGYDVISSPAVANGFVYIGGIDNNLYQLNATNISQQIAVFAAGLSIQSSPAVVGDYVYVSSMDYGLYQLNATNISGTYANSSSFVSKFTASNSIGGSPTFSNGSVYVGDYSGILYQLNATNVSHELNRFTATNTIVSTPAIGGDYIYFGDESGIFYQLRISNISNRMPTSLSSSVSSGGSSSNSAISLSLESMCSNNTIRTNIPNVAVRVTDALTLDELFVGTISSDHSAFFSACERSVRIYATRNGYRSVNALYSLSDCSCVQTHDSPIVIPPINQNIEIDEISITSENLPVVHESNNSISSAGLVLPSNASLGNRLQIEVISCIDCSVIVISPSGSSSVLLPIDGRVEIPLVQVGTYSISLSRNDEVLSSSSLLVYNSSMSPDHTSQSPAFVTASPTDYSLLILIVISIVVIGSVAMYYLRRK